MAILKYSEEYGPAQAARQYGISQTILYKWRNRYEAEGTAGLEDKYTKRRNGREQELELEIRKLKELVAEQALELHMAKEVIKKKNLPSRI